MSFPRIQSSSRALEEEAFETRREIVEALYSCGGGHYGGALSALDIILTLYRRVLRTCPEAPSHSRRDRFILSKGHSAIALYAVLRRLNFFNHTLDGYGSIASSLEGHPDMTVLPGIDFSTGSLGQGLSVGMGMAMALSKTKENVWVLLGDGECQEGQVWEAAMLAHRLKISNLYAVIDANGFQEWGWNYAPGIDNQPVENLAQKWQAFGWQVLEADGHDFNDLERTFAQALQISDQPKLIYARTIKGKGFPLIEKDPLRFHCTSVSGEEQETLLADYGK